MVTARQLETAQQLAITTPLPQGWVSPEGLNADIKNHVEYFASIGIQVLPAYYGTKKTGIAWKSFQYYRLQWHRTDYAGDLKACFQGRVNLLVICGVVSSNLVVVDCDTQFAFERAVQATVSHWGNVFAVVSPKKGGHLYFFLDKPVKSAVFASGEIRSGYIDSKGETHSTYVIAPPSYRLDTNSYYQWHEATALTDKGVPELPPVHTTADELVRVLGLQGKQGLPLKLVSENRVQPVSESQKEYAATVEQYLLTGHSIPEGEGRNNALFAAAVALCHCGRKHDLEILRAPAAGSGLPDSEITNTLQSALDGFNDPNGKRAQIASMRAWIQQAVLTTKRTNTTDRAVLLAMLTRYQQFANSEGLFAAPVRTVAEMTNLRRSTVQQSIHRLIQAELITDPSANAEDSSDAAALEAAQHTAKGRKETTGKRYALGSKLLQKRASEGNLHKNEGYTGTELQQKSASIDRLLSLAASRAVTDEGNPTGGIGTQAIEIYKYLIRQASPVKQAQIVEDTGIHKSSVSRGIKRLLQYELIEQNSAGYFAQLDTEKLKGIASQQDERIADRKQLHTDERHYRLFKIIYRTRTRRDWFNMPSQHVSFNDTQTRGKRIQKAQQRALAASQQQPVQPDTKQHPSGHDQQQHTQPAMVQQDELQPVEAYPMFGVKNAQKRGRITFQGGEVGYIEGD